jgi:hypothetical protein
MYIFLEVARHLLHPEGFSVITGIILVYDEASVDVDQKQGVLVPVGYRIDADRFRQLSPFSIR